MPDKNILIIAPHMDDEVLGCAGAIRRHVINGDQVTVCFAANRAYGHAYRQELIDAEKIDCGRAQKVLGYQNIMFLDLPDERLNNCQVDLISRLEEAIVKCAVGVIYLPHQGDNNPDHRAVFEAARVALRPYALKKAVRVLVYEMPSSTDIMANASPYVFLPNYYVDITDTLEDKIKAMACYKSESRSFPHPRSPEAIRACACKRGVEIGMHAAESFMVIRDTWSR